MAKLSSSVFLLIFFAVSLGWTQGHTNVGNAGFGVKFVGNPKLYLFDFVEAGIEETATISSQYPDVLNANEGLKHNQTIPGDLLQGIAQKLSQVSAKYPDYATALYDYIKNYHLLFVQPQLMPIDDLGRSPIRKDNLDFYLIASRHDSQKTIYVNRALWAELDKIHQVGLIFHEANYALLKDLTGATDSAGARALTAYVFSPFFAGASDVDLSQMLLSMGVPSLGLLQKYSPECRDLRDQVARWIPLVTHEFTVYMQKLEELRKKSGFTIMDDGDLHSSLASYVLKTRGDMVSRDNTEALSLPSFITPLSRSIPRQINICEQYLDGRCVKPVVMPAQEYSRLLELVEQGQKLRIANSAFMVCVEGTTEGRENIQLLERYSSLRLSPLYIHTK